MGTYINRGDEAFRNAVSRRYVDKTAMVAYINSTLNTSIRWTCVSRPRRFGKSMAANMLAAYYDKSCDSADIFDKLSIAQDISYKGYLNQYPVIFIDITTITTMYSGRNDIVKILQRRVKKELAEAYPDIKIPRNANLADAISLIAKGRHEKFIMLIDEWDAMCRELASKPQVMDEYVDLLRRMFKASDTADMFAGVYMTGILPIKKYGTQSALNNFREYSMTTPGPMAEFIGFNEDDVMSLSDKYGMPPEELRQWYDGYKFTTFDWRVDKPEKREISIYNSNSVMTAIDYHKCDNYWSKSESFEALQDYIDMDFDGVKETLEKLVLDIPVTLRALSFGNDQNCINSSEELFTLLVHYGYLSYDSDTHLAVLPNQEIREEFVEALRGSRSHKELSKLAKASDKLLESTLMMDEEAVAEGIEQLHNHKVAPNFYNNEQALRSVVRMAYLGAVDYYIEIQELPSGKGYCDLAFLPRRGCGKPAMVVELKWMDTAGAAIKQIKDCEYPELLKEYSGEVLLVGITYDYSDSRKENTKKHLCTIERWQI